MLRPPLFCPYQWRQSRDVGLPPECRLSRGPGQEPCQTDLELPAIKWVNGFNLSVL